MTTAANSLKKGNVRFPVTESLLLLVAIFWGTSYGLTKSALAYTSVLVFISIRFSITFLCLLPVVIRDFRRGLNKDWKIAIPTGFILSAIFFCEVFGVSQTSASNAAFLISLSVILTAFAELLINKKKVSNTLWGLTACSVAGVLLLTSEESVEFSLNSGDYFILTAALLRALMVTMTKRFTEGKVITTSTLTSLQSLVVALVAIVCAVTYLPTSEFVVPASWEFWLTVIYLVLFCTLFAFYVQNYAVRRTSPTRVSLLMGSEPLFGALFAMAWLQESFTTVQVIGGVLILFSVVVTSTKES
ncbi:DMT family transporter [Vibrio coralliilyticus]|uniref:DMT family transporter n=1 Tax=Vibrio coralliilyticus TaxID=190893 RepID=A0AAP7DB28_9VIBR|nr:MULTISPECIES: DMT family transporter [Vibrio]AXN34149.1 DMT family transporter [Vibrio coralliilyticus]KFI11740.1 membrane protein [Vibrio sp. B183]KPH24314.1 membrane protein [Vibrio coralliilyticus]NOI18798.1 DMT family transporter [Vibrio coralliilyticus]NOJ21143.1 DMT family transporter [Vibrio coralliilyticus]